ncbi:hypothetical protein [Microlunatus soli]|uniref:hypothetical protein n=1 Tax=Microlunatus soli TaxID=630515 RepID=UPI0012F725E4|nr:hypothetical protein [Microlunatus soli]
MIAGLGLLALGTVIGLTLLIMVRFGIAARRLDRAISELTGGRLRHPVEQRLEHRRNIKALKNQCGIPIERLSFDLRRLRELIAHSHGSATQQSALRQAYDGVLMDTCRMLDVPHELDRPTAGLERDIERVRVEAVLESRGIVLSRGHRRDQNADH